MKTAVVFLAFAGAVFGQNPAPNSQVGLPDSQQGDKIKIIPPAGVTVAETDQKALHTSLARLQTKIDGLRGNPHLADVQVFAKAVSYALDGSEFFAPDDVFKAKELLR